MKLLLPLILLASLAFGQDVLDLKDHPLATPATPAPQVIYVQAPATPAPITPQAFTDKALQWIQAATIVGMALVAFLGVMWARLKELAARQDRQAEKTGSLQEQVTSIAKDTPPVPKSVVPILALCLAMLASGCSTTTADPAKNARNAGLNAAGKQALRESAKVLGEVAVSSLLNVAQQELGGRNVDFGQAAAVGVWSNVNVEGIGSAVAKTIQAYSAGKGAATAQAARTIANRTLATGQPAPAVVDAIASVISTAAGAPPVK